MAEDTMFACRKSLRIGTECFPIYRDPRAVKSLYISASVNDMDENIHEIKIDKQCYGVLGIILWVES